jgi:hypothetical protein
LLGGKMPLHSAFLSPEANAFKEKQHIVRTRICFVMNSIEPCAGDYRKIPSRKSGPNAVYNFSL